MRVVSESPEFNVAVFAFLLNYPWEFLQVRFFAGMAEAAHWDAIVFCSVAALGDAGIALVAFWTVAAVCRSRRWIVKPSVRQGIGFVSTGLAVTVTFEWLATRVWARWEYAPAMPTLPVLGTGALPLLQWLVLPPILIWIVRRQILGSVQVAENP
jgi:hypothetical protein